jgi:hypothetical protein
MKTNIIHLRPDRLDLPLDPCTQGRLSSAVLTLCGDIPDDIESLAVVVEYRPESSPSEDISGPGSIPSDPGQDLTDPAPTERYTAAATRQDDGTFLAYLAPAYFPTSSDDLKYHVVGTDTRQNPRWLGSGTLSIVDNPANGSHVMPDILPRNLYAYSPTRRCYFKVIATENKYGEIKLTVDETEVHL